MSKVIAAVRLEEQTIKEIEEIAAKKRRTKSDLLRIIIEDFVKQHNL